MSTKTEGSASYSQIRADNQPEVFLRLVAPFMDDAADYTWYKYVNKLGPTGVAFFRPVNEEGKLNDALHSFMSAWGPTEAATSLPQLLKFVASQFADGVYFEVLTCGG
jgi:hypothetical protein